MKIGDRVKVAASPRYPGGRNGIVRDVYEDDFGRWFEIESNKDRGVFWTLTELQVEPVTSWLNVDFVPDNRATYKAIETFDRHWLESQRLQQWSAEANQYPVGSPERAEIMKGVIDAAYAHEAAKAADR